MLIITSEMTVAMIPKAENFYYGSRVSGKVKSKLRSVNFNKKEGYTYRQ